MNPLLSGFIIGAVLMALVLAFAYYWLSHAGIPG